MSSMTITLSRVSWTSNDGLWFWPDF